MLASARTFVPYAHAPPTPRAPAPPRRPTRGGLDGRPPFFGRERRCESIQVAFEHLIEVVNGELHAVVGDPVLGKVVRPDLLGSFAGAGPTAPRGTVGGSEG